MNEHIQARYSKLGPALAKRLESRFFKAAYFDEPGDALEEILRLIPRDHVVSWGGSMTLAALGAKERLAAEGYSLLDRDKAASAEERADIMRKALLCDTFLTSVNAISEDGQLVCVDGAGNRVAAMAYGPRQVIVVAGMNKAARTLDDAVARARNLAAPTNALRFPGGAPCRASGACHDCASADSICSLIVTTRLCKPAGRIKVILVGKDLGF